MNKLSAIINLFPYIVAISFLETVVEYKETENIRISDVISGSFRSITNVADFDPEELLKELLDNKKLLIEITEEFKNDLNKLATMLENSDRTGLLNELQEMKEYRDGR